MDDNDIKIEGENLNVGVIYKYQKASDLQTQSQKDALFKLKNKKTKDIVLESENIRRQREEINDINVKRQKNWMTEK